jgi:hypothetical protein
MNADQELERRIADFYASEAPARAPDWALASALATIDMTRQRSAPIRVPWRFPTMNACARVAIATMAVIVVMGFRVAIRQADITTSGEPDAGWLQAGPQPGLPLVGPIWTEEAELSGDAASSASDGGGIVIVASLEFTADGHVVVDTGSSTLRINDLTLSEPTCGRTDTAAFDARMRAFLSASEFTYTIDLGVLELTAGPATHRLRGTYDGPPG